MQNKFYLIANAHIDPVWQWQWEEGAAEAISTFRVAADLCEEYDYFVFNHNESCLYQWIEEYEPELFKRIQCLVKEKKWFIIGGWFLQPDCNLPSGESFVRQILTGNLYFYEKFGVKPTVAANFDSFGHSRGLVQILAKSGYSSYVFTRPEQNQMELPKLFQWVGFDGSSVLAYHSESSYQSEIDRADVKIKQDIDQDSEIVLWGVGNHGGGASRADLRAIEELSGELKSRGIHIIHATLDDYFKEKLPYMGTYPEVKKTLYPSMLGCYTSHIRIKRKHRKLESQLMMAEKMSSHAAAQGLLSYPKDELDAAFRDLMLSQFHDALPGSSIQRAEEDTLRALEHGLEMVSHVKMRSIIALSAGQKPADPGDISLMVYNPHPYAVKGVWCTEVQPLRPLWGMKSWVPVMYKDGKMIPSQSERADTNFINDIWRKAVSFEAELPASSVTQIVCKVEEQSVIPVPELIARNGMYCFKTSELEVIINEKTGLIDKYAVNGKDYLKSNSFEVLVMKDTTGSWGTAPMSIQNLAGRFTPMDDAACARTATGGAADSLPAVHVIEDGCVRTIVEAVFQYENSIMCQQYILPRRGTEIQVNVRIYWNEPQKTLKISVPTTLEGNSFLSQTAFGINEWPADRNEVVTQKWIAAVDENKECALSILNDCTYGADMLNGELRISLLRASGYVASADDGSDRPKLAPDRFSPHCDMGDQVYNFRLNAGSYQERLDSVEREAQIMHESPMILPFTPSGGGEIPIPLITLSNPGIELITVKPAEKSEGYIIRLFEPRGTPQETKISLPVFDIEQAVELGAFEILTLKVDPVKKKLISCDLLEDSIPFK